MHVTMLTLPTLTSVTITPSNVINGGTGTYTVTVVPGFSMQNNDYFYITFPAETTVPKNPSCVAGTSLSAALCTLTAPNTLQVKLTFTTSPTTSSAIFSFAVSNVQNPPSTKPSSPFTAISVSDSAGNSIGTYTGTITIINKSYASASG